MHAGGTYDAIVAGCGPCGAVVGRDLARKGFRVLILEEHHEVGRPVQCAGLVTRRVLDLVPAVLWAFKIAEARGKSVWVGVLLLLPITNVFAFLYLAFSNGGPVEEDEGPEPKVMSLQVA
jgi:hypothetical protein